MIWQHQQETRQTYVSINHKIHIQIVNIAHPINTTINKYSLIIYFQKDRDVMGILV